MSQELTYSTPEGETIFTSRFLKNRGTCCRSACLHCPYGLTLKRHGLTFREVTEKDFAEIESLVSDKQFDWATYSPDNVRLIYLKDHLCGVFFKNHIIIKRFFLKEHFQDQGLSKEMIESYFFI